MIVGALIEADDGYLCQLRDDKPGIKFPGVWGFFGGHADPGETAEEALRRELREELEYDPPKGTMRLFFQYGDFVIFSMRAQPLEVSAMRLHEGREMRAFRPEHVHRYEFIPGCRTLLLTINLLRQGKL